MELAVAVLPIADLAAARAFYVEGLGFDVDFEFRNDDGSGMIGLRRGTLRITLDCPMQGHGRNACVALHVDDADRYYEEWRTRVPVDRAPRDEEWGGRTFGVTDPSGNTIFVIGPIRGREATKPRVGFGRTSGEMRKQYFFRPSPGGFLAWDVDKLVELTAAFPRRRVPLSEVRELNEPWFGPGEAATWTALVEHVKLMDAADLKFPIILAADGTVMDGMHRAAKALRAGHTHIEAVQFTVDPPTDHHDVQPTDLPY